MHNGTFTSLTFSFLTPFSSFSFHFSFIVPPLPPPLPFFSTSFLLYYPFFSLPFPFFPSFSLPFSLPLPFPLCSSSLPAPQCLQVNTRKERNTEVMQRGKKKLQEKRERLSRQEHKQARTNKATTKRNKLVKRSVFVFK